MKRIIDESSRIVSTALDTSGSTSNRFYNEVFNKIKRYQQGVEGVEEVMGGQSSVRRFGDSMDLLPFRRPVYSISINQKRDMDKQLYCLTSSQFDQSSKPELHSLNCRFHPIWKYPQFGCRLQSNTTK